jgi:hypothetical protein
MFTFLESTQKDKFIYTHIDLIQDKKFPCLFSELLDHFDLVPKITTREARHRNIQSIEKGKPLGMMFYFKRLWLAGWRLEPPTYQSASQRPTI